MLRLFDVFSGLLDGCISSSRDGKGPFRLTRDVRIGFALAGVQMRISGVDVWGMR
jgi:hypothetical protein